MKHERNKAIVICLKNRLISVSMLTEIGFFVQEKLEFTVIDLDYELFFSLIS